MKTSGDRILTTHVGSLPRPVELLAAIRSHDGRDFLVDRQLMEQVRQAVSEIVEAQVERGIDIVTDGELAKPSFVSYVNDRLAGFEAIENPDWKLWDGSKEMEDFGEYYAEEARRNPSPASSAPHMVCTSQITYVGQEYVQRDIDNLKAAMAARGVVEGFLPAISPTNVSAWQSNKYYDSDEEYLFAIAEAMAVEYSTIVDSGLIVQIDDPGLVTQYAMSSWSVEECRVWAETRVAAINHALRGIPSDRVRFHTCYSVNMGPRAHDMELKNIVDLLLQVNADGLSFEAANPRHEHEWRLWEDVQLPEGKILIPGVVTNSSVLIEHPDLVAERILRFVKVVGAERVIASADCGFATFAGATDIHPSIAWAKLAALGEGARRASAILSRKS